MAFEEFYQSIYHDIFLKWILLNSHDYLSDHIHIETTDITQNYTVLSFEMDKVIGTVTVWSHNIVEEEIHQKDTQDLLFYIHYTIVDLAQAKSLFQEFYRTLLKHNQQKVISIGLCSSDGFSTSLFVEELKTNIELDKNIHIESLSLDDFYKHYRDYDALYLTPQIAHMEPELIMYTQHLVPIYILDATDFATKNYQSLLKDIQKHLQTP